MITRILIIVIALIASCQASDTDLVANLRTETEKLDQLVRLVNKDKALKSQIGKFVKCDELDPSLNQLLDDFLKDVHYVVLDTELCADMYHFEIYFGKNRHLVYHCDHDVTDHEMNGFIEVYQINKDWYYLINHDFIG